MSTSRIGEMPAGRLQGLADLAFEVRDGRTRLTRNRVRPPLVVQRALYPDESLPDLALVYLANSTAGVLQGDDLTIAVSVGPDARVHLTTPSATKVFSMPHYPACQQTSLTLGQGAYLEYLPEPVIPFRNARFSQTTSISVAEGATLILGEIITPGRVARGEILAYEYLQTRLTVNGPQGYPIYHEASRLTPKTLSPLGRGVLGVGNAPVLGTLLIVTEAVEAGAMRDSIRDCLKLAAGGSDETRVGVTTLPGGGGVGLKVLASETEAVKSVIRAAWAEARRRILHADLPATRRY